ncbi:hypothetical protein LUZ60_013478 [Juncus effusus]|nr:hypothetical protein LUZ60_013478 [Juncus effusus]
MRGSEFTTERKSRFWQIETQPVPKSDVICPQPCRVSIPKYSSIFLDSPHDILDLILGKNDSEDLDSAGQTGFFCGSPPVRTNNPLVKDAQFLNQIQSQSPLFFSSPVNSTNNSSGKKPTSGSPNNCSSSPEVRIEGFTCKSVPTFA